MAKDDKDIHQRIDELNPDTINWNDANAYAALGSGAAEDGEGEEAGSPEGDTIPQDEPAAPAAAPAPAPAPAASAPAPAPAGERSASPAAAPAPAPAAEPDHADGVATRDGKRIIPYAVLQATRRELAETNRQLEEARQQLASKAAQTPGASPLVDRAASDPESLTDDELAEIEADFPALAKPLRLLRKLATSVPAAAPAPAASAAQPDDVETPEQREFYAALDAAPLVRDWMGKGGQEWERARAIDNLLVQDSRYQNMTIIERLPIVQRMVAAEFGVALPSAAPPPAPAPAPAPAAGAPAVPAAREAAMPTLSDLGGATPRSDDDTWANSASPDLLARAEKLTDAELLRLAGIPT